MPFVSIIIVNYNGRHLIETCLSSVINTNYPNFEIIVVDNHSTDDSVAIVRNKFSSCKVIQLEKNMGFAIANNIGTKNAKGDYFVFLNNDTYVTPEWIRELVMVMEKDHTIAISQSLLLRPDGSVDSSGDFATRYGRTYSSKKLGFTKNREILSARGAAMIVRKTFFLQLNGFDEDYFISFEDVELGWKAWILGYRVVMVPTSIVYHEGGATTNGMSPVMTFNGLKNQLSLITTHFEGAYAMRNLIAVLSQYFFGLLHLLFIQSNDKYQFEIDKPSALKAVFWYVRYLPRIWNKHSTIRSLRRRSTKELIQMSLITDSLFEN